MGRCYKHIIIEEREEIAVAHREGQEHQADRQGDRREPLDREEYRSTT